MKKLSEYKDEEALDIFADLLDPVTEIIVDKEIKKARKKRITRIQLASLIIKRHKKAVIKILSTLEGVPIKDYHCDLLTLPRVLLEIMNDKDLMGFFDLSSQKTEDESSGSATESGKVEE